MHTMANDTIAQRPKRSYYALELKGQIVAECQVSGASVAGVALAHRMNANIVHRWMREHRSREACSGVGYDVSHRPTADGGESSKRTFKIGFEDRLQPHHSSAGDCGRVRCGSAQRHNERAAALGRTGFDMTPDSPMTRQSTFASSCGSCSRDGALWTGTARKM
jgi:hypothetical protein